MTLFISISETQSLIYSNVNMCQDVGAFNNMVKFKTLYSSLKVYLIHFNIRFALNYPTKLYISKFTPLLNKSSVILHNFLNLPKILYCMVNISIFLTCNSCWYFNIVSICYHSTSISQCSAILKIMPKPYILIRTCDYIFQPHA